MEFIILYKKTIEYFPKTVDISDGKYIESTSGYSFSNLSNAWMIAESKTKNIYEDLLCWVIFRVLHREAVTLLNRKLNNELIIDNVIDVNNLNKLYLEAFLEGGYNT